MPNKSESSGLDESMSAHADAVDKRSRFAGVTFNGVEWDLSHLTPFALTVEIEENLRVDVVVLFSCHCFTYDEKNMILAGISPGEIYRDEWECRVLSPERYRLSRIFLPKLIRELPERRIRISDHDNFFTTEAATSEGKVVQYAVFFTVTKDSRRKRRLLLRVQSAYPIDQLSKRQEHAGKANFAVLVRAVYMGRRIRG